MNESIGNVMKSGFPLLLFVLLAMLLVSLWRQDKSSKSHKLLWTAILTLPSIISISIVTLLGTDHIDMLGGVITGRQPFIPPWNKVAFQALTFTVFFLPFSGVLAWLLLDRDH